MNSRSQTFELRVEGRQIDEAVASLFHTVLFHRTLGKFTFEKDGSYSVGTVGYQDVDCDFIDITYVCCSSLHLDNVLKKEISKFSNSLRRDNQGCGQISLEFFQKKKSHWPLRPENISWEVWNVHIELLKLCNENDRLEQKMLVGEKIGEKIINIAEIMNQHEEYLPSIPPQSELGFIFDTSFPDVQPYLFKLVYTTPDASSTSLATTFKQFIQGSLSL